MDQLQKYLKGKIIYAKVNEELLDILSDTLKHIGNPNSVKIGDIVVMDEYGCRLSSKEEDEQLQNIGFEGIIEKDNLKRLIEKKSQSHEVTTVKDDYDYLDDNNDNYDQDYDAAGYPDTEGG